MTTEIYADTRSTTRCRGCHAPIVFAEIVRTGRRMPFNEPLIALRTRHDNNSGWRLVEEVDLDTTHFATCPQARQFSRGGASRGGAR
jgi:hypothetical protein